MAWVSEQDPFERGNFHFTPQRSTYRVTNCVQVLVAVSEVVNIYQDVGGVDVYVLYRHTGARCCQRLRCKKQLNEFCVKWFGSSGKKEAI